MIKHLEIKSYEYGDISVTVKIDYEKKTISLVEKEWNSPNIQNKKWVFADRDLSFKNGWMNILHAMEYAIKEAFTELEEYSKMKAKEKMDSVEAVLTKATEIVKSKSKKK